MDLLPPLPIEPYNLAPFPTLTDNQLAAIVARHRLTLDDAIAPMPTNGVVHALWSLGSSYVLRVPKRETMCIGDLHAEVAAIPAARAAGLRTPDLVAFDDACDIVDVPYAIVERVHGVDLTRLPPDDRRLPDLYGQLGTALATLHTSPLPDPHPWFRVPETIDGQAALHDCVAAGMLGEAAARWLRMLLDDLAHATAPNRFLHNDVKPDNLMVDEHDHLVLIDWGDAGFGDPASDFGALPTAAIAAALVGYRGAIANTSDPTLEQRVVRGALSHAIAGLRRTPLTGPSWYRPVAAGLADLLAFATDEPEIWHRWIGR